jgi:hypothetical protein
MILSPVKEGRWIRLRVTAFENVMAEMSEGVCRFVSLQSQGHSAAGTESLPVIRRSRNLTGFIKGIGIEWKDGRDPCTLSFPRIYVILFLMNGPDTRRHRLLAGTPSDLAFAKGTRVETISTEAGMVHLPYLASHHRGRIRVPCAFPRGKVFLFAVRRA